MVELLEGFPEHVAAYKAEGEVNDLGYRDVVRILLIIKPKNLDSGYMF